MKVNVPLENGYLPDLYGKYSSKMKNEKPVVSFPIEFLDIPENTQSVALVFSDPDSIPVCGFEWIHWTVANLDPNISSLKENASQEDSSLIQGKNSSASPLISNGDEPFTEGYNGPMPPDKDHNYVLKVYALDEKLDIKQGFWLNKLINKSRDHIIDSSELVLLSRA
ncbi:YbhB/YbcL family Raf kinase inhibitor-like protein [Companilactobacillus metriopterae]|uniref:YbhB/YbcL family Raf kinase inhibitor-like protein n=1 Tax=Companilactobacillus metriopterae TaxID=1909267 RepID=UPI00100AA0F8|nr:YbhB/YbcL family Raf kinase inhibitor-like protein [Companilactobacillus metriopterae]